MSTKLDMNFAMGVKDGVSALISEVQRLETYSVELETRIERLRAGLQEIVNRGYTGAEFVAREALDRDKR